MTLYICVGDNKALLQVTLYKNIAKCCKCKYKKKAHNAFFLIFFYCTLLEVTHFHFKSLALWKRGLVWPPWPFFRLIPDHIRRQTDCCHHERVPSVDRAWIFIMCVCLGDLRETGIGGKGVTRFGVPPSSIIVAMTWAIGDGAGRGHSDTLTWNEPADCYVSPAVVAVMMNGERNRESECVYLPKQQNYFN